MTLPTALMSYAIGLGSNRRHGRHGPPERVIGAAVLALGKLGRVTGLSSTIGSAPLGPSRRRFANAVALIETRLGPTELLIALKAIEHRFGRRPTRRWGARVLDLDILLWSGGRWQTRALTIPHRHLAERPFAIGPLATIAPRWRLPGSALSMRHLAMRLTRTAPLHRGRCGKGP